MKEDPKQQFTEMEKYNFWQTRGEASVTEEQLRRQMEGEFGARQKIVDFLAGTKEGDLKFEYFKRFTDLRNTDWYVKEGTDTTKGNPAYMAILENREFLKIHKKFESIWFGYWRALSERSFSPRYTDKLLAQELKKIEAQKEAEFSRGSQQKKPKSQQ